MAKSQKHFQNCKKPTECPICGKKRIIVILTEDRFWKVKCKCNPDFIYI